MREVEDAHQPVDQREPGGDRKYIAPSPSPVIVSRTNVLMPHQLRAVRWTIGLSASSSLRRADVHDAPGVEHDRVARDPLHDAEVLLDEQHGRQLRDALEHARDLGDEQRRETLRRLVDEQDAVVVQERACDRDHLLLAAGKRARELLAALLQLGEEVVDELVAAARRRARRAEDSRRR